MKSSTLVDSSLPVQIWNTARQLDNIPVISTSTLIPAGARAVVIAPHPDRKSVV